MRLIRIKIAGFKSFVDPTDLKLPSSLVGIVGPNGCGKSNTIDAVRWVMGESSAKHLRGESMDDVIFTGSRTRKPVGQASVELVFDNSDGSLGGEYASYAEISIKREVTRDGQSKYLLNGTRCRRRDIRDIFLGTGLGPRSYAIIEQGMISRLIEAKPEDMRVYLEEAAGISKYKERRRETENRIRHTRDNLDRLDDLREEVDKQIEKLKRQADTAARYKRLKEEERQKRGELLALRRQQFAERRDTHAVAISAKEAELEGVVAELRSAEAAIEQAREQQADANDRFSTVQADFYRIGGDVSRIEQTIEHTRATRRQQNQELADVDKALSEAQSHQQDDARRIAEIDHAIETDQPAFDQLEQSQRASAELLMRIEQELAEWRTRQDTFNTRQNETAQAAEVERTRIEQLDSGIGNADARLQRLGDERAALSTTDLEATIATAIDDEVTAAAQEATLQDTLQQCTDRVQSQREQIRSSETALNDARRQLQEAMGRLAALEALQQAALEPESRVADDWLRTHDQASQPRLAECLQVTPGWEAAVELVLGNHLDAVCVDATTVMDRCLQDVPEASLTLLLNGVDAGRPAAGHNSLLNMVTGADALVDLLSGVRIAASIGEALALRDSLATGESVITADGIWLSGRWLRVARASNEDSVLVRETEIARLKERIGEQEASIQTLEKTLAEHGLRLDEQETRRETTLHGFNDAVRHLAGVKSNLLGMRQQFEQLKSRSAQLDDEMAEARAQRERDHERVIQSRKIQSDASEQLGGMAEEATRLQDEQSELATSVSAAREQASADRDAGQALAIRVESLKSTREATQKNLDRMETRIEQLTERQRSLNDALAAASDTEEDPLDALQASLVTTLDARAASETALATAREQLDSVETRLRDHEQARQRHDSQAQQMRETLQQAKLESQEVVVRLKTVDEQLAEQDYVLDDIVANMTAEATVEEWETAVEGLERRIQRLGAINLAAIEEHEEQVQRKEYLDTQHADVIEALDTLERAIAKIDKETRARFRETFDRVNTKVQEFFPRLFGGGKASLELTGDDLLNTGVTVSAQPPGKRVSNIQLLSGGEKALTAVALVFAFFELNPSPFCMLDEVDAPLDDANVGRFCSLVKEMSERVQFIFITHNKVTMEMASQLMGVTMNEPGVSRLVAVDVNEAAELAGV